MLVFPLNDWAELVVQYESLARQVHWESANCAVIDFHFVVGVYIFHSVHLLHQQQLRLPANHTLIKKKKRNKRLNKHGHSFPPGHIVSYQCSDDAFKNKTRDLVIFYSLVRKLLHQLCNGNHQVLVVSRLLQGLFSQTFPGTLSFITPGFPLLTDEGPVTLEINNLKKQQLKGFYLFQNEIGQMKLTKSWTMFFLSTISITEVELSFLEDTFKSKFFKG